MFNNRRMKAANRNDMYAKDLILNDCFVVPHRNELSGKNFINIKTR